MHADIWIFAGGSSGALPLPGTNMAEVYVRPVWNILFALLHRNGHFRDIALFIMYIRRDMRVRIPLSSPPSASPAADDRPAPLFHNHPPNDNIPPR